MTTLNLEFVCETIATPGRGDFEVSGPVGEENVTFAAAGVEPGTELPLIIFDAGINSWERGIYQMLNNGGFRSVKIEATYAGGVLNKAPLQGIERTSAAKVYPYVSFQDFLRQIAEAEVAAVRSVQSAQVAASSAQSHEQTASQKSTSASNHEQLAKSKAEETINHEQQAGQALQALQGYLQQAQDSVNGLPSQLPDRAGPQLIEDPFYLTSYAENPAFNSVDGPDYGKQKIPLSGILKESFSQSIIELVNPFNFGFEGLKGNQSPAQSTDDPWDASPEKPVFNTHSILQEGGFGSLFRVSNGNLTGNNLTESTQERGHILKITTPNVAENTGHTWLGLRANDFAVMCRRFEIVAWIYVKQGGLRVGNHAGSVSNANGTEIITAADCEKGVADHPFQFVRFEVETPYSSNSTYRAITFGPLFGQVNEIYIAGLNIYPLRDNETLIG